MVRRGEDMHAIDPEAVRQREIRRDNTRAREEVVRKVREKSREGMSQAPEGRNTCTLGEFRPQGDMGVGAE